MNLEAGFLKNALDHVMLLQTLKLSRLWNNVVWKFFLNFKNKGVKLFWDALSQTRRFHVSLLLRQRKVYGKSLFIETKPF